MGMKACCSCRETIAGFTLEKIDPIPRSGATGYVQGNRLRRSRLPQGLHPGLCHGPFRSDPREPALQEPGPGWVDERGSFSAIIGLAKSEKSVALHPLREGAPCHGWSRTSCHVPKQATRKPHRIAARRGCSRDFSREAEISGRQSTKSCSNGSSRSAPKYGICVDRAIGGVPGRRPWKERLRNCTPSSKSTSSSAPPRRAGD